jgi:hypothetical protein
MLQAISSIDPRILAISLTLLVFALALVLRRRINLRRLRGKRLADQSAGEGEGESSMMPLAHLASAVEVLDLDDLLAGEEGSVAAAARRQLEAPTDVTTTAVDTFFPLPPVPAARQQAAEAAQIVAAYARVDDRTAPVAPHQPPVGRSAEAELGAERPGRPHGGGRVELARSGERAARPQGSEAAVPVRELALAWFEARGYRPSSASPAVRPIELVLRHRKDPGRAYAFIVEKQLVTSERVNALLGHAQSIGLTRVLVAAESGIQAGTRERFRRQGVRLVDQSEMQREFDKLDLRVAAKIIAVARNRARLRSAR